jgi:hypothetical protein
LIELLEEKVLASIQKVENMAVGIRYADYVTPLYPQMMALTLPTSSSSILFFAVYVF